MLNTGDATVEPGEYPYLVMGPDIHGPTIYARCKKLSHARAYAKGMEKHWTILRIVTSGEDLMVGASQEDRDGVTTIRDFKHAREEAEKA